MIKQNVFSLCISGTGKSLIIKYITALLHQELGKDSYILCTPTGVSATLINGKTLHSVFQVPKTMKEFRSLTGEKERQLQNSFKNVKFLILDEYSMVGCKTLAMIDARCRQATGNANEDFGGLHVYFLGDIRQLPPVYDNAFFSHHQETTLGKKGKSLIKNFEKAYLLNTCHRQNNMNFLHLLDNISNGKSTQTDYNVLATRFRNHLSPAEIRKFDNAIRLFATKNEVLQYNLKTLVELTDDLTGAPVPVVKLEAMHNCTDAKKGSVDDAEGLEKTLYISKGCKIMLRKNLWVDKKLVNGTIGRVIDVIYDSGKQFPSVILCEFDNYEGPAIIPGSKIIPIKPVLSSWQDCKGSYCTRYQFPISLCYACSIHKSQGMTLDKVIIMNQI